VIVERFVEAGTDLVLRGQDFELRLAGQCSGGCTIDTGESGREVLTLERDGRANVGGEGFLPGTPVYIWLFSEPKFLGELTVNADGTFTGSVSLEGIEVGEHTLQVNGTSFDGVPRSANLGVLVSTVGVPAPDSNHLPATGSDLLWLMTVALALISAGAISVSRRPRPLP
jgi:LPXTG-motif cell wall-anchored protein